MKPQIKPKKVKEFLKSKKGKRLLIYVAIGLVVLAGIIAAAIIMDASVVKLVNSNPEAGHLLGGGRSSSGSTATIRAQANPGYTFVNWTNADGSIASAEPTHRLTVPESDITLTANWKMTEWDILLTIDSDENTTVYPTSFNVKSDTVFLDPPTKEGHTFLGWYKDAALTQPAKDYIPTGTAENVVLYAKWAPSFLITYDLGDPAVSNSPDNPTTYTEHADVVLENPVWYEVKDGALTGGSYYFLGWYDDDGNKVGRISKSQKADVTVHARWDLSRGPIYYSVYKREIQKGVEYTYVDLGRYPQHILGDQRTASELKTKIVNGELTADPKTGYYTYNNNMYAMATASPYQNDAGTYRANFSNGEEVKKDEVYFFIVEPIKWRVLSGDPNKAGSELLLLSEDVLDAKLFRSDLTVRSFEGSTVYANNWEYSDLRAFLTGNFYNEAFMTGEREFIISTTIDTGEKTAHFERYANGKPCVDKVFLLSYADIANKAYGWNHWTITEDTRKIAKATDYAKALGAYASLNRGNEFDAAHWWLRSSGDFEGRASVTSAIGTVGTYSVDCTAIGVRPAITVKLK
ncbi:MAG TPA: hypothetical protein DCG79_02725 [Clostridiales bacterium]|nr:hypothetical protein [Clostridiales bacterium]